MISYDNNATKTIPIAMRIEQERRAEQQRVVSGGSVEEGLGLRENACRGSAAGASLVHSNTHIHTRRYWGGNWARSLSLSGDLSSSRLCSQHAIKCFCLINKKINFYETCLKQTTKIDWPDKMQLRFAKPTHTHTHAQPSTHSHTNIHTLARSLSKKCARACGLYVSSLLPESFVLFFFCSLLFLATVANVAGAGLSTPSGCA